VRSALAGLKGVKEVEVSFAEREASILFADKGNTSLSDVLNALRRGGFQGSPL